METKFTENGGRMRYLGQHFKGQQSLVLTVFVNGLLAYVLLVAAVLGVARGLGSASGGAALMALFAVWLVWWIVGVWRWGVERIRKPGWAQKALALGVIGLVGLVVVVVAQDLMMLFGS